MVKFAEEPEEKPAKPPKQTKDADDPKPKKKVLTKSMISWIIRQRRHHHGGKQDKFEWQDLEDILL